MKEAVIVSAVRTPLGSFNGSLGNIGATRLGAIVIEEAVKRAGIEKNAVCVDRFRGGRSQNGQP